MGTGHSNHSNSSSYSGWEVSYVMKFFVGGLLNNAFTLMSHLLMSLVNFHLNYISNVIPDDQHWNENERAWVDCSSQTTLALDGEGVLFLRWCSLGWLDTRWQGREISWSFPGCLPSPFPQAADDLSHHQLLPFFAKGSSVARWRLSFP